MKKDLHPQYFEDAIIKCACGATFTVGSTEKEVHVDICSMCHPFYTGKEKLLDTAGRVDKFRERMEAAKNYKASKKPKVEKEEDEEPELTPEAIKAALKIEDQPKVDQPKDK